MHGRRCALELSCCYIAPQTPLAAKGGLQTSAPLLHACWIVSQLIVLVCQVRNIWYDYWNQCDVAFGAELKAKVQESLKKM
jgi:hypothetical protein